MDQICKQMQSHIWAESTLGYWFDSADWVTCSTSMLGSNDSLKKPKSVSLNNHSLSWCEEAGNNY